MLYPSAARRQLLLCEIERISAPVYHFYCEDGTRSHPIAEAQQLPIQQRERAIRDIGRGLSTRRTQAITDAIRGAVSKGVRNPTAIGVMGTHVTQVVNMYLQGPEILRIGCNGDTEAFRANASQWHKAALAKLSPLDQAQTDGGVQLFDEFAVAIAELLVLYVVATAKIPATSGSTSAPQQPRDDVSPHSNECTPSAAECCELVAA